MSVSLNFLKARGSHDTEAEGKALFKMEGLMVGTLQHLSCIIEAEDMPSNIDEAAEKIASDIAPTHPDIDWDECFEKIKDGIKAGAEWMVGQFQKIKGKLVDWYETNGVDYCCGISTDEAFEVPEGFYIKKK